MKDQSKIKDQLIAELKEMRQRVSGLEENEARNKKALEECEDHFRVTFEQAAIGIAHLSPDGSYLRINQKFCDIVGYSQDEMLQLKFQNITWPEDLDGDIDRWKDLLSGKTNTLIFEKRYAHKTGEPVWVILSVSLVRDEAGQPKSFISVIKDITERKRAENKLYKEMNFSRTLLQASPVFYVAISAEGKIMMVNMTMIEALGYREDELIGKDYLTTLVPEKDREELSEIFNNLVKIDGPSLNENHILARDGRELLIEWHGRPVIDENEKFDFFFGVGIDITERNKKEKALQLTQASVDNLTDAVYWIGPDGKFTYVNSAAIKSLGYSKEELLLLSVSDISPEFTKEIWSEHWDELKEKKAISLQTIHQRKDGSTFPVDIAVNFFQFGGKEVNCAIAKDVTERKKAEVALSEAYKIINRSPAVVVLWKNVPGWPVEFASENVEILTGYSAREFMGNKVSYSEIIHKDDRERVAGEIMSKEVNADVQTFVHEPYRIMSKSGETKWIADSTYIRRDFGGKITHLEGIVIDLTERLKLEGQLRQAQKMESVGRLAGGVAHDFNNMLSVILGHVELALGQIDTDQPLFEDMQAIRAAARRSADLTRQLLAFARKEAIAPIVLDINETVEGTLKMLRRLIGEDINLAWLPGNEVWPVKVDPSQIDHLLANLCVNARDAIEGVGKITIETRNTTIDESYCVGHPGSFPGEYVQLAVSDNGCGMDKEILANIFEPFFTLKDIDKGTGLGLATVYGIVKQNNGFINVYSEPGIGSTFKIYLPRMKAEATQMDEEVGPDQVARGHEIILLVEDEAAILKMVSIMLERYGYTVLGASSPGEALRLYEKHADEIDLFITDVIMPEMSGQALARNLLSLDPELKCLFISGYTANVIARHGVLDEGVNFLQKPFTPAEIGETVREVLDSK